MPIWVVFADLKCQERWHDDDRVRMVVCIRPVRMNRLTVLKDFGLGLSPNGFFKSYRLRQEMVYAMSQTHVKCLCKRLFFKAVKSLKCMIL